MTAVCQNDEYTMSYVFKSELYLSRKLAGHIQTLKEPPVTALYYHVNTRYVYDYVWNLNHHHDHKWKMIRLLNAVLECPYIVVKDSVSSESQTLFFLLQMLVDSRDTPTQSLKPCSSPPVEELRKPLGWEVKSLQHTTSPVLVTMTWVTENLLSQSTSHWWMWSTARQEFSTGIQTCWVKISLFCFPGSLYYYCYYYYWYYLTMKQFYMSSTP